MLPVCRPNRGSYVVGYQNRETGGNGWQLICNTFLPVNGDKTGMKLSDFTVNADWDWSNDTIQFLNASGGTAVFEYEGDEYDAIFTYVTPDDHPYCEVAGWYQYDAATEDEFISVLEAEEDTGRKFNELEYGFGAVYQTMAESAALVYSGAVSQTPQTVITAANGWRLIGNANPVAASFEDIAVNADWDWSNDTIQFLNASGGTRTFEYEGDEYDAIFTFVTPDDHPYCEKAGWYQYDAATEDEFIAIDESGITELAEGECVVVQAMSEDAGIQFPAAL